MKTYAILCFVLALAMFVSPVAVLNFSEFSAENVRAALFSEEPENDTQAANTEAEADTVAVLQAASGKVVEMETLEYLVGCVACEMPPDYSEEALKAQTVAAYTNLIPVLTLLLGVWLLREVFLPAQYAASALIIAGVLLSQWRRS